VRGVAAQRLRGDFEMEKQQSQKHEQQVLQYGDLVCIGDTDTPGFMAHDQGITDSLSVCKMVRSLSCPVRASRPHPRSLPP
jgi:hypothetical protein